MISSQQIFRLYDNKANYYDFETLQNGDSNVLIL